MVFDLYKQPIVHVWFAQCEDSDTYKSKIKPPLKVFKFIYNNNNNNNRTECSRDCYSHIHLTNYLYFLPLSQFLLST